MNEITEPLVFHIVPPGTDLWWLYGILIGCAILAFASPLFKKISPDETPWRRKVYWANRIIAPLAGCLLLFVAVDIFFETHATVRMDAEGVVVDAGWLFPLQVPYDDIQEVRVIAYGDHPDLRVTVRTYGTGAPGFLLGWMRLVNGKDAYVIFTYGRDVAYLTTASGHVIMLELREPQRFVDVLNTRLAPEPS